VPRISDPLSPAIRSAFLADTPAALAKRRRAIRHKVRSIKVKKILERTSADEHEKLEISVEVGVARATNPIPAIHVARDQRHFRTSKPKIRTAAPTS